MMSTLGARYGQGDSQVCLSYAWCAQQQEVGGVRHEGHARQLPDLALVDGGLEAEVELLQGTMEGQVGQPSAGRQVSLSPCRRLDAQQVRQHLGGGLRPCLEGSFPWTQRNI